VEIELRAKTEVLEQNLPQCLFVHHKPHMTWPELGRRSGKPATKGLRYGTAQEVGW
jgi:hypothetical protein